MIRRRLSSGLLRAAAPSRPSPAAPPARTLASAVLLTSQTNWKTETVVTLKAELKKRGLSQQGNKATLVSRLESAETSSLLPPVPPIPSSVRSISSSTSFSRSGKLSDAPKASASSKDAEVDPSVAPGVSVTGPGLQVISQRTSAVNPDTVSSEQVTVAPGLPESKIGTEGAGETLDVRMPSARADEEIDQVIPLIPDNFSAHSYPSSASTDPKVLTVASASTHPAGGPVHASHDQSDAHSLEIAAEKLSSSVPSLESIATSMLCAPVAAWSSLGLQIPKVGVPQGGSSEYKYNSRGLNQDEKRGAWILAGLIGAGLLLGGPKKDKASAAHEESHAETQAKRVVGDAKWAQASGAGVVGHGARKD
ncbi:hypothetical protein C356_02800 [Cryptococcus neoformans c45]|nr:hypothetical protein C356_02800 [Cryptococcus neoformans var. grubii c45]